MSILSFVSSSRLASISSEEFVEEITSTASDIHRKLGGRYQSCVLQALESYRTLIREEIEARLDDDTNESMDTSSSESSERDTSSSEESHTSNSEEGDDMESEDDQPGWS